MPLRQPSTVHRDFLPAPHTHRYPHFIHHYKYLLEIFHLLKVLKDHSLKVNTIGSISSGARFILVAHRKIFFYLWPLLLIFPAVTFFSPSYRASDIFQPQIFRIPSLGCEYIRPLTKIKKISKSASHITVVVFIFLLLLLEITNIKVIHPIKVQLLSCDRQQDATLWNRPHSAKSYKV